jgi:hypothetical protein
LPAEFSGNGGAKRLHRLGTHYAGLEIKLEMSTIISLFIFGRVQRLRRRSSTKAERFWSLSLAQMSVEDDTSKRRTRSPVHE